MLSILIGLSACALACVCIYLVLPHQQLRRSRWPVWPACAVGVVLLVVSWLALAQGLRPLTASFVLVATVMLVLSVLPYLGAWRVLRQRG